MSELTDPPFDTRECVPSVRIPPLRDYESVVINGVKFVREDIRTPGPATKEIMNAIRKMSSMDRIELAEWLGLDEPDIIPAFLAEWPDTPERQAAPTDQEGTSPD